MELTLLTDDQRKFYDLVLESTNSVAEEKDENDIYPCSIVNMENTVLTQAEIRLVITAVKEDNPMLFWLTDKFGFSNTEGYTAIQLYSYKPPEKIKTMQNKLSSPIEAAVTRSIYNLISALQTRQEKDWFIYDLALTKYWQRKGPYLFPKISKELYGKFILHCLDLGIVVSPVYEQPSIVPFGADRGVFEILKKNPIF